MGHRVAILWHEREQPDCVSEYSIDGYARMWREAGLEVVHVFGVDEHVAADVLIVHVDLSVVPGRYLRFAQRYTVSLNGRLRDIRKSTYSPLRLNRASEHTGKVIVKTNRNHGGRPEKRLAALSEVRQGPARYQRRQRTRWTRDRLPYRVYDRLADVPLRYFVDPRFIVERLMSEAQGDRFWTRYLYVFGDRVDATRVGSESPIVTGRRDQHPIEPDPQIIAFARQIGLDYGKIDYVVHEGQTYLLDVNKTMGAGELPLPEAIIAARRWRGQAIYDFLPGGYRPGTNSSRTSGLSSMTKVRPSTLFH